MTPAQFLAVDLGASSGRVVAGEWSGRRFALQELHRFANEIVDVRGALFWDILRIWTEIKAALRKHRGICSEPPRSIGVDAWGVDFALLDRGGRLLSNPYSYRDPRTGGMPQRVHEVVPAMELFRETGAYPMAINTLYQLFSMTLGSGPQLEGAETLLMIPDLIRYWLCGDAGVEYTQATTTQMYAVASRGWAFETLARLGIPGRILPSVVETGTVLSAVSRPVAEECGFASSFPVVACAAHDTASAVAAIPEMDRESAFLSSGTWSLMGVELDRPLVSAEAFARGFTNEGAADGGLLLIRNITGLWILEECLREWRNRGLNLGWEEITEQAESAPALRSLIDPDAGVFRGKGDMPRRVRDYCRRTGQPAPETPGEVARCLFESLSLKYRSVFLGLQQATGRTLNSIRIVGGGSRNRLLCQMTADACGRLVVCGPAEASALGSVMQQAVATGHLASLAEGREAIADSYPRLFFHPRAGGAWEAASARFQILAEAG